MTSSSHKDITKASMVSHTVHRTSYSATGGKRKSSREGGSLKPKTILQHRKPSIYVPVILDGVNVTPTSLNPYIFEGTRERQISIVDHSLAKDTSMVMYRSLSRVESQKFQANILHQKHEMESQTVNALSYLTSYQDDIIITAVSDKSEASREYLFSIDESDDDGSSFDLKSHEIPKNVSLILSETETIFLLDFPSCTEYKGTDEGEVAEEDNKAYDYLTKGKGRNRKVFDVGIQTVPVLMKSRDTEVVRIKNKHDETFVSNWEMFDTFKEAEEASDGLECDEDGDYDEKDNIHKLKQDASLESYRTSYEDKQMEKLIKNKRFLDAVLVIERLLASNCYNEAQKRYKALSDPDDLRENIEYKYRLQHLWTFASEDVEEKCVVGISINHVTDDIIAVGYGKFFYIDKITTGIVLIWNIKNPQQPERRYKFLSPVTSLEFSKKNPNLLAVGFYNGDIKVIDVSKRELLVIREETSSSFEPVWDLIWFPLGEEENIMACFGDGKVIKYQLADSPQLKFTQIMKTAGAEGKLKGIEYLKKCQGQDISISRYAAARTLAMHPVDPSTYYVGTTEGVVHKCSINYYNQHMDLFKAHEGAVHLMKFSPFANKLYFTCGDDFRARLWIHGIAEPLLTSEMSIQSILGMDLSPQHANILASIRGTEILIWDLQRKMYAPQSRTKSPTLSRNTVCKFTPNGRCLVIGDIDGNVHVFSLEDMPMVPFFPEHLVKKSLQKLLVTRPELVRKLNKIRYLNFDSRKFEKYFN